MASLVRQQTPYAFFLVLSAIAATPFAKNIFRRCRFENSIRGVSQQYPTPIQKSGHMDIPTLPPYRTGCPRKRNEIRKLGNYIYIYHLMGKRICEIRRAGSHVSFFFRPPLQFSDGGNKSRRNPQRDTPANLRNATRLQPRSLFSKSLFSPKNFSFFFHYLDPRLPPTVLAPRWLRRLVLSWRRPAFGFVGLFGPRLFVSLVCSFGLGGGLSLSLRPLSVGLLVC